VAGVRLSVVIPALEEAPVLERVLASTRADGVERIVVDGGSRDGTAERAEALGAECVISAPRGRARQMDAGWRVAVAPIVLFLHADTRLEAGWDRALLLALADPRVAGGAFRLAFEATSPVYRVLELGVRARCRLGGHPYGDQGLFARRAVLERAGGVAPTPIFEDLDLVRAIRAEGRLALLETRAWTSARRYQRNGVLRTVLRNNAALLAYLARADRDVVAAWYRGLPRR
jgi:rSAM/selenodomain-associated transferase 2